MHKNTVLRQKKLQKPVKSPAKCCKCAQENKCNNCIQSQQKLSQPTYNSTLRHLHCIEQLRKLNCRDVHESKDQPIPPSKITQKLNFGTSHTVFKNLTPINVNDSLLLPKEKISFPKKYVPSKEKIPEPELCDFLEPIEPLSYTIPEPELKLDFVEYEFDVVSYCRSFLD